MLFTIAYMNPMFSTLECMSLEMGQGKYEQGQTVLAGAELQPYSTCCGPSGVLMPDTRAKHCSFVPLRVKRPSPISLTRTLALSALSYKSAPELASVQGLILREKQHSSLIP